MLAFIKICGLFVYRVLYRVPHVEIHQLVWTKLSVLTSTGSLEIPPSKIKYHHQTDDDPDSCNPHPDDDESSNEKKYKGEENISKDILIAHFL
jgi:hypothetical protein